jgi:hypothetical protein
MPIASGVAKVVSFKKQTNFTTPATGAGGYGLRRVTSDLSLTKDPYESEELSSTYQRLDVRSGVRSVTGTVNGELSPGSYQLPLAALLHRDFTAVTALTAVGLTIGTATNGIYPLTRSAGDWYAGGLKVGHMIRLSVGALNAANINKNLLVVGITSATVCSVMPLNGVALVPEGPVTGCTVTWAGKYTFAADASHTDDSFTIEHWYPDVAQSEVFNGCKFTKADIDLPPTGIAKINIGVMGRDMTAGTAQVLTSPTALSGGVITAVNGVLLINGVPQTLLTGLSMSIDSGYSAEPVVGSNLYPEIFRGRVIVKGQATVFFQDAVVRDLFVNETNVSIVAAFANGSGATADFVSFCLPNVKFMNATKSDGPKGLTQTMPFEALYLSTGGAGTANEKTTVLVHDSLASV